jgi:DNA-directed RNA polymerase subunit F
MPEALRHYRKVVELDPENAQAKAEIEQIEGIYRSLDREIPQGVAE